MYAKLTRFYFLLEGIPGFGLMYCAYKTQPLLDSKIKYMIELFEMHDQIFITNASGCGNHAIWEFHRGEGLQDVGQYNLEIIFRLPYGNTPSEDSHYIDWNIEINGRELIDHDDDLRNLTFLFLELTEGD